MKIKWQYLRYSKHHTKDEGGDYYVRYGLRRLYLSDFLWYGKIIIVAPNCLVIGIHKSGKYFYCVCPDDCRSDDTNLPDFDCIDEYTSVRIIRVTAKNIACIK